MKDFLLSGTNIGKAFSSRKMIFHSMDIELRNRDIIGIGGENGSGKTTLLKIISGLIPLSQGELGFMLGGDEVKKYDYYLHFGYVAPYLNIYEEFTPLEHIAISSRLQGHAYDIEKATDLLKRFNLYHRRNDYIRTFSSGMKQRMKYILALIGGNEILLLDEPFTNLDEAGINAVKTFVAEHVSNGGGVIIASNDEREKELCNSILYLKK